MLRRDEHDGSGYSNGGDSPQQSPRHSENQGAVWHSCYEYAVVTSRLKRVEAEGHSSRDEDIEALWRKRAELAKGIVDAAVPGRVRSRARSGRSRGAMPESSGAGAMGIVPAGPGANCRARGAMGLCR